MYKNSFFKKILIVTSVLFIYSCDKDYNSIGDGLIADNNFKIESADFTVLAYNQKIGAVESNNLLANSLGIYSNPAFGTTTANFAAQLTLGTVNPTIGKNPEIESVILTIPYYSTLKSTDATGNRVYELDSIYGSSDAKIKLSVYRSGYFMRNLDPIGGFQQVQNYFTNQNADFNNVKVGDRLNNDADVQQNDAFAFSALEYKETVTTGGTDVVTRTPPGMRLNLDKAYFKTVIIDAVALGKLATNEVFRDYFRGLYFKVEKSGANPTAMAMLNFKEGKITIKYKVDASDTDTTKIDKSIVLDLIGNTVSLLEQSDTKAAYTTATDPVNINSTVGDAKLYLKGGEGSMAIVELFGKDSFGEDGITGAPNGVADELDMIRKNGWLINEASLVFHVDESGPETDKVVYHPKRVYLYDLNNNRPVVDYFADGSTGIDGKSGKLIYDGILNQSNAVDKFYKIRITNQVRNLVKNTDSTNVKLGLVVTEDINVFTSNKLRSASGTISKVPKASVLNPLGTILYGSNSAVPGDKKLKLEIYYTKPN
jgi:hypothetical protein